MAFILQNNGSGLNISGLASGFILSSSGDLTSKTSIETTDLVSSLQTKISSIDLIGTNVSSLSTNITTANSNISTLSSSITTANSNISTLSSSITTANSNISSLQTTVSSIASNSSSGITLDDTVNTISNMSSSSTTNFAKEWRESANSGTPNIIDMCCSGDGRVSLVCPWSVGNVAASTNYGETWFQPSGLSSNIWSCSASLDGKYIVASDMFNYKISSDYGASFTSPSVRPSYLQRAALSATGKYIISACGNGNGLQTTSNYGTSWVQRETDVWSWNDACIALDGSVIYACSDSGLIKKSVNYGSSWTTVYTDGSSSSFKSISCSNDGKYVLAGYSSNKQLLLSSDYGATFNLVGTSQSYYKVAMSMNGVYMIGSINGSGLYYSINSGSTWTFISNNKFCAIAMSYGGDIIYNVSPYNKVLISQTTYNITKTSAPTVASAGSSYFDTSTNKLYIYNGSAWKSITLA
jgi:hypothetical protein